MNVNTIKLAYDWIGPTRIYNNNQPFTIDSPLSNLITNYVNHTYFEKVKGYTPTSSLFLKNDDVFIYEFSMGLDQSIWFNHSEADLLDTSSKIPATLDKIRYHYGYILIELGQESLYSEKIISDLHNYFRKVYIPLNKVILQVGNPQAHDMYDKFCFERGISKENRMHISTIEFFEFKTSILMHKYAEKHEPRNLAFTNIKKTFLCFNRNHKHHRINLTVLFYKANLLNSSYFSMTKTCPSLDTHFLNFVRKEYLHKWNITNEEIEEVVKLLPLTVDMDDVSDVGSIVSVWGENQAYYKQSLISVVTESFFSEPTIFNTEKIWNPISYKHPFIMVGAPGTLEHLKNLGYKTFSDFWDESYDKIEDPTDRLQHITSLCMEIDRWSDKEKKEFFYKSIPITEHNYSLLKSICGNLSIRRGFWHDFRDAWAYDNGGIFKPKDL